VGDQAPALARLRAEYDERVAYYSRRLTPAADATASGGPPDGDASRLHVDVRMEALDAERQMLVRLRDQGVIGDEVLRRVQQELDLEASRFSD
jgi:CPA1 family monovalent cation:H+ antiporter